MSGFSFKYLILKSGFSQQFNAMNFKMIWKKKKEYVFNK